MRLVQLGSDNGAARSQCGSPRWQLAGEAPCVELVGNNAGVVVKRRLRMKTLDAWPRSRRGSSPRWHSAATRHHRRQSCYAEFMTTRLAAREARRSSSCARTNWHSVGGYGGARGRGGLTKGQHRGDRTTSNSNDLVRDELFRAWSELFAVAVPLRIGHCAVHSHRPSRHAAPHRLRVSSTHSMLQDCDAACSGYLSSEAPECFVCAESGGELLSNICACRGRHVHLSCLRTMRQQTPAHSERCAVCLTPYDSASDPMAPPTELASKARRQRREAARPPVAVSAAEPLPRVRRAGQLPVLPVDAAARRPDGSHSPLRRLRRHPARARLPGVVVRAVEGVAEDVRVVFDHRCAVDHRERGAAKVRISRELEV